MKCDRMTLEFGGKPTAQVLQACQIYSTNRSTAAEQAWDSGTNSCRMIPITGTPLLTFLAPEQTDPIWLDPGE